MIKEQTIQPVDNTKVYEVYDEVNMQTADGETVNVLQLVRSTTVEEQMTRIEQLNSQIQSFQVELNKEQLVLDEINNL
jgi:hypothetical protein